MSENNEKYDPIDLSEADGGSSYISQSGTYDVAIISCKKVITTKGTDGYKFTYKDAQNRIIQDTCFLTQNAQYRLYKLAIAAKLSEADIKAFIPPMIIGKTIQITTRPDPDNPQYQKVNEYKPSTVIVDATPVEMPTKTTQTNANDDLPF